MAFRLLRYINKCDTLLIHGERGGDINFGKSKTMPYKTKKGSHLHSNFLCHIKEILYICSANKNILNSKNMTDKDSHNCVNTQMENLDGEVWKDIAGYEGSYQVSNMGRVKSLDRMVNSARSSTGLRLSKGRVLKTYFARYGKCRKNRNTDRAYELVHLYNGVYDKAFSIHRLVAKAFIPNPNNLPQVNHKDENPANNRASNLEWCDSSYNANYGTRNKRVSTNRKDKTPVNQFSVNGEFIAQYESLTMAAKSTNVRISLISAVCRGLQSSAAGFVWKFADSAKFRERRYKAPNNRKVVQLTPDNEVVAIYDTLSDASVATGARMCGISQVIHGKHTLHHGYKWMFSTDFDGDELKEFQLCSD